MSFVLELKDKVEHARNDLQKKSREEKLEFLIRAGLVDEKGKLRKRFKTVAKAKSAPSRQRKKKAS